MSPGSARGLKVLHLLASPFFSGPAEAVLQLALAQRALGHDVTIAVDRKRQVADAEELAVPRLRAAGLLAELPLELSAKSSPLAVARDIQGLKALHLDVLHCHFSHDHLLARWGRPRGARLVRSVHAPRSLRRLMPRADGWTVPTDDLARQLLGQTVLVLPALIDPAFTPAPSRSERRRELGLPDAPLVGMVSTFQASRRHALGLAAFEQLTRRRPDAHLVLVGDGAELPAVKVQVGARSLSSKVHFAGYQRGPAFIAWLQALDEVWVLGLGNDFAARAAAQARACGARVVAVDEGALARYADALVLPEPGALADAALTAERRTVVLEPTADIAQRVIRLYALP
jgi:L-malate glycosyltransferase